MARRPLLLLVAAALLVPAATAPAKLQIGISEQSSEMFANRHFKPLKIRYGRIVVPWNILTRTDYWPAYLRAWLDGAKANGVEPHVAFNIVDYAPRNFGKGPTIGQYRTLIAGFRRTYPEVRVFTPWNEANHAFQPTARKPRLAYLYYRTLRRVCPSCKILAADVLDDASLTSWLRGFKRYYNGVATWGLHNYQDANKHRSLRSSWTYQMTKLVRGDIWSTEAGGIVGFKTVKGRVAYKYSLSRQLKAQRYLFKLMGDRRVRNRYKRVYIHSYFGTWAPSGKKEGRWDSGLLNTNGTPRPAYRDLRRQIAKNGR